MFGAAGATWQARERLGWQAEEAGAAPSALEQWQQAAWPPQPSWWSQLWPWCADPQVTVRVTPLQPGGRAASAAELTLPASQLAREGLRPEAPPPLPAGQHLRPGDRPGGREEEGGGGNGYYSYNSSDMAPLLPLWLSWMADASHMSNRSRGLDFDVARTLSRYVAVAYCNISNIQPWNCSRCGGDASGFTTERVVFDPAWDLLGYVGYSQPLGAIVVAFRGTDSHSIYNWWVALGGTYHPLGDRQPLHLQLVGGWTPAGAGACCWLPWPPTRRPAAGRWGGPAGLVQAPPTATLLYSAVFVSCSDTP